MKNLKANCPICSAEITLPANTEESEIISCLECNNRIVVTKIDNNGVVLDKAPEVEEDWGE